MFLLDNKQFQGDRNSNPYLFRRQFVQVDDNFAPDPATLFYVQKVSMKLSGVDISGYDEKATFDTDMVNFFRLNKVMGYGNRNLGADISLPKFLDNSWMSSWNLSTRRAPAADYVVPSIRRGVLKLNLEFSRPIFSELVMVVISEFPSVCSVDEKRNVFFSYFTSLN